MVRKLSGRELAASIGLISLMILPGCNRGGVEAGYWEAERERIELAQALSLSEYRLNQRESGGAAEFALVKARLPDLDFRLRELTRQQTELAAEINEIEERNDAFLQLAIRSQRSKVVGKDFDVLELRDGRIFRNVSIRAVDDGGVAVRHEHGAAKLRYADLSREQHALFGLEKDLALVAEQREHQQALVHEEWIDSELEVLRENEERDAVISPRKSGRLGAAASSTVVRNHANSPTRALAQPATPVGSGRWSGYSRYRTYRPTYHYVRVYRTPSRFSDYGSCSNQGKYVRPSPTVPARRIIPKCDSMPDSPALKTP